MATTYQQLMQDLAAPKAECHSLLTEIEALSFPAALPLSALLIAARKNMLMGWDFAQKLSEPELFAQLDLEKLLNMQQAYYQDLEPETGYATSFANPDYAVATYGSELGALLSAVYQYFSGIRTLYLQENFLSVRFILNLYLDLYHLAEKGNANYESILQIYKEHTQDNLELRTRAATLRRLSPENDYNRRIVELAEPGDLRYMFRYGIYISENDLAMARFTNSYDPGELESIAQFIVQCFIDGFVRAQKDYRIKRYANVMLPLGMEALGRFIIRELAKYELQALVPTPMNQGINRQVSYDHRFDSALTLSREHVDKSLKIQEAAYAENKDLIALQAGPLYVELFGETPFSPEAKSSCLKLSDEQQVLYREFSAKSSQIYHRYARRDESSFTIIAFPSFEIGGRFPEIFADTLKINLLDSMRYAKIQQHIIDLLDTADYVHVKGKAGNNTDIMVKMHEIADPATQTIFENCVADVNIPVGEVFTSPVLKGSTGTLHVEDIYLGSLRYYNLTLHFEDGWVKDYSCSNFADPAEGKRYIHENLLLPHETLPIGEFAIGTNTTAYQIAKKYDIMALLPILIIEKMGPHFAIGDTCYSHEEDAPHPNFLNAKEMIAVENEKSALRKSDPLSAYTQKHMDITLPYEMLQSISVIRKDGSREDIIRDGLFVVPGTEELNAPLRFARC